MDYYDEAMGQKTQALTVTFDGETLKFYVH
jgi:hypothetical protein